MPNFNSAVMLAKVESSFRVDASPTPTTDALLIIEPPDFSPEVQRIQRSPARASLSKFPGRNGRIRANIEFVHEVIGAGVVNASKPPPVDALLRASGMARTDFTTTGVKAWWARKGNTGTAIVTSITRHATDAYTPDYVRYYTLNCTTAGGSGVAQFTVTAPAMDLPNGTTLAAVNVAAAALTTGTVAFPLANGAVAQATFTGNFDIGDKYVVMVAPPGSLYTPVSTGFESMTSYIYYEGVRHVSLGARGSWSLEAVAGDIAKFTFNMVGDWADPTDAAIPTNTILTDLEPPVLEFANVRIDNEMMGCPVNLAADLANELNIRECANGSQGYAGGIITGRTPTVSFDPDFATEATYPFWNRFKNATEVDVTWNIGSVRGNMCHVLSHCQISANGYGNRNNSRIYEIEAEAVSRKGDDELCLFFY